MYRDDRLEDLTDEEFADLITEEIRHRGAGTRKQADRLVGPIRAALGVERPRAFRKMMWVLDSALEEAEMRLSPQNFYDVTDPIRHFKELLLIDGQSEADGAV